MEKHHLKIISGGQTGVDRAALDTALKNNLPVGGWCPKGRRAEDGTIDLRYPLKETVSEKYQVRTELNVRESDGTLIICRGTPSGGTALTIKIAREQGKALLIIDLLKQPTPEPVYQWILDNIISTINIAGPRESQSPGIYQETVLFLEKVIIFANNG
ncbi:MAG: putative molybdenum carrier protein [Pseudomonadota bacterium]|nr:putative molybdenum carrier protein [Pseudomonadota bacterium]